MSVDIFGVDDNSESFGSLSVASETTYYSLWRPIIEKLKLKYIGDQRWLFKKDLPYIISEFQQILQYVHDESNQYSKKEKNIIELKVNNIVKYLEKSWNEVPNAERLWMG